MNTHRLRRFEVELGALRDRARELGDTHGADRLDGLLERVHELVEHADGILARIGNPPTDDHP